MSEEAKEKRKNALMKKKEATRRGGRPKGSNSIKDQECRPQQEDKEAQKDSHD